MTPDEFEALLDRKLDPMREEIERRFDRIEGRLFFGHAGSPSLTEEIAALKVAPKPDHGVLLKQVGAIVLAIITAAGGMWGLAQAAPVRHDDPRTQTHDGR